MKTPSTSSGRSDATRLPGSASPSRNATADAANVRPTNAAVSHPSSGSGSEGDHRCSTAATSSAATTARPHRLAAYPHHHSGATASRIHEVWYSPPTTCSSLKMSQGEKAYQGLGTTWAKTATEVSATMPSSAEPRKGAQRATA